MNQVNQIGRLTRDPELRYIPSSGTAVCRFVIAINRDYKKEGQATADFINIKAFGKTAENAANYLKKGLLVAITGRMQNNNYEDKNGTKHYGIEVIALRVQFLEWKDNNQQSTQTYQQNSPKPNNYQQDMNGFQPLSGDDDIPF